MTESGTQAALVSRYEWRQDEEDEFCIDRLTGETVVRYDLGDPANYRKSHGGWSRKEWLAHKGLDPEAEIDAGASTVQLPPNEATRHAASKRRREQREREEAEARELLEFLGDSAARFNFDRWRDDEEAILRPALEAKGFVSVGFYMMEEDSFGPLVRGCVAISPEDVTVRFYYG